MTARRVEAAGIHHHNAVDDFGSVKVRVAVERDIALILLRRGNQIFQPVVNVKRVPVTAENPHTADFGNVNGFVLTEIAVSRDINHTLVGVELLDIVKLMLAVAEVNENVEIGDFVHNRFQRLIIFMRIRNDKNFHKINLS